MDSPWVAKSQTQLSEFHFQVPFIVKCLKKYLLMKYYYNDKFIYLIHISLIDPSSIL